MCCYETSRPLAYKVKKEHSLSGVVSVIFLDIANDDGTEQTFVLGTASHLVLQESEIDMQELFCDFEILFHNYEKRFYARDLDKMGKIAEKYFGSKDELEFFGMFDTQPWKNSKSNIFIKETSLLREKMKIIEVAAVAAKMMNDYYGV